jgi:predicted 2-oxoglutarate/Fe(II)-dependent dioxygenase YbiX
MWRTGEPTGGAGVHTGHAFVLVHDVLSAQQCSSVARVCDKPTGLPKQRILSSTSIANSHRSVSATWLDWDALPTGVTSAVVAALNRTWPALICIPSGPLQLCRYEHGGFHDWHSDVAPQALRRHISMVCFVNPPDDYRGGDLIFRNDASQAPTRVQPRLGAAVFFASATPHRVDRVAAGMRLTMCAWFSGTGHDKESKSG